MHRLSSALLAILLATAALLSASLATAQQTPYPWPTRGWPASSPEEQGMSSERLPRLVDFGSFNEVGNVLGTRPGRTLLQATYRPFPGRLGHRGLSATNSRPLPPVG